MPVLRTRWRDRRAEAGGVQGRRANKLGAEQSGRLYVSLFCNELSPDREPTGLP